MLDGADLTENPIETGIRQEEWITTGEKDVANRTVGPDVVDCHRDIGRGDPLAVPDDATTCTVSAVEGTFVGRQQEHTISVPVQQRGHG